MKYLSYKLYYDDIQKHSIKIKYNNEIKMKGQNYEKIFYWSLEREYDIHNSQLRINTCK